MNKDIAKLNEKDMEIVNERIALGDKKVKKIVHALFSFEEQSILANIMDAQKIKIFRSKSRDFLARVVNNFQMFRY
jgi:spore coat polysaccharide biosynthesis protein SpsF (cytidylyltransferase family)